ncbi:MAG: phosphotransferase family protein [Alphaproteobacteria bacterium]|nr:phosphotransferase family protein [Alphaproteobacteria bacterium]|tara:strand:- start:378 stop:1457 length:1080 start_codon:yes stop_codon:yes gene_type:complete
MASRTELFSGVEGVRPGYEFDVEGLEQFMKAHINGFVGPISVNQFKGGQSNPTYRIDTGDASFTLRRKPPGKLLPTAHAVDREYKVISALQDTGVPVPKSYALCEDDAVIGTPFYIMEFVEGRVLWEPQLPGMASGERSDIYDAMNSVIARLHGVDVEAVGLSEFGRPGSFVERQIRRWSRQYLESGEEPIEELNRLCEWLPENLPDRDETTVVHGDYRIDNMIFYSHEARVVAVLDWELSTLGDPVGDFAYHVMQWRLPPHIFHGLRGVDLESLGIPSEEDYVSAYCERTGRDEIPHWDFYMAYCMFRLSAILHGILVRVRQGTAASAHGAGMGELARPIAELAWQQVEMIEGRGHEV